MLFIFTCTFASTATHNAFQVDVIAFRDHSSHAINQDSYPPKPNLKNATALSEYELPIKPYMTLPKDKRLLNKEASKLESRYNVLFYKSFIQTFKQRKPVLVQIDNLEHSKSLIGIIKVTKGNFYYFTCDLLLGEHHLIKVTRRLRSNELHLIDDPEVSLLIKITPIHFSLTSPDD